MRGKSGRQRRWRPGSGRTAPFWCARGPDQSDVDQCVAHHGDVGVAAGLIAGKIDRDEFLVDEDAADEDDRRQVEQVNQQEFLADAETGKHGDEGIAHANSDGMAQIEAIAVPLPF